MIKIVLGILLVTALALTPLICCGTSPSFALEPTPEHSGQTILLMDNCDHNRLPAKCICSFRAVIKSKIKSFNSSLQIRLDKRQAGVINYAFTFSYRSSSNTNIHPLASEYPASVPAYIQNKSLLI
jgi:hypothetical protein